MTALVLVMLVAACAFYVAVLLNIQREIQKAKHDMISSAKVVCVDRAKEFSEQRQHHDAISGREQYEDEDFFVLASRGLGGQSVRDGSPDVVRLQTSYFGPFFLVPIRKPPKVTRGCDEGHTMPLPATA